MGDSAAGPGQLAGSWLAPGGSWLAHGGSWRLLVCPSLRLALGAWAKNEGLGPQAASPQDPGSRPAQESQPPGRPWRPGPRNRRGQPGGHRGEALGLGGASSTILRGAAENPPRASGSAGGGPAWNPRGPSRIQANAPETRRPWSTYSRGNFPISPLIIPNFCFCASC